MPIFNYLSPDIADYPILYPTINNNNWVSTDGEICTPSNEELIELLANENPPLICHRKWTEKKIGITEVVLRDGIQSLLATRVPLRDLVSILPILDKVGYWSLETWGGATYDACIRYLNEDPWERLRTFHSLLKNTPQQMLIRGQNLVGYKHYSDQVVSKLFCGQFAGKVQAYLFAIFSFPIDNNSPLNPSLIHPRNTS